ncbi:sulfotransferase [Marinomonas transparens]|uniref:Sulfotransferase n=1 Tax=Marinomonas transparens TaxID=2795388 RepID=A0A934JWT0_9GAMM|nr:sulfotransferase [Marinomonas transparens]MBJ7539826.1 sulfotransferase [Marinomonas transparens]
MADNIAHITNNENGYSNGQQGGMVVTERSAAFVTEESSAFEVVKLRSFVANQQFNELKAECLALLSDMPADQLPKVLPVNVLLALAYAHLGERENLLESLVLLEAQQDVLDKDALCDLAAVYIASQQIEKAHSLLKALIKQAPKHDLALARLAWCHMVQGESEKALLLFVRSLAIQPLRMAAQLNRIQLWVTLYQKSLVFRDGRNNDEVSTSKAQSIIDFSLSIVPTVFEEALDCLFKLQGSTPETLWKSYESRLQRLQLHWWVLLEEYGSAEQWLSRDVLMDEEDQAVYWGGEYATLLTEHDQHGIAESFLKDLLKVFPNNIALLLFLSELAQMQGMPMPAMVFIHRAIQQEKESSALWVRLSGVCLHHFSQKARHAAEKAVTLADAMVAGAEHSAEYIELCRIQAKHALAMVESDEQAFDKAESLFVEILAERPYFLPALSGLGQQKMQQGRIEEAVSLFEKVKEVDPVKGISSLINARHFPEDEETLDKLEKSARLPSMEGSMRSSLLFQLASAWEKRKNFEKAFSLAEQANESSLRFLKYDAKDHRNHCARLRYAFSSSLYEHRPNFGVVSSLPVFVLGMPRSGTTLVEQIISGHSDIFGAGELGLIPNVIQGLNRWERHVGSGRQYPDCVDDLGEYVTKGIANNVLQELQAFAPDAKHIVDKLPHNFENIGLIKFLFPHARIISVRRDPRDIALSNYFTDYQAKHGGMGFAYDLTHIGEQLADHNLLMHHWNQVFPGQILEVNYEDVVEDLEGSARKMLDYIGVEWQPEVLKFNELERSVKTASVWQVRQPLYKTSKAKWLNYKNKLAPLTKGTNAPIEFDAIEMMTLPLPDFLSRGVAHFDKGELDEAEACFKKMLHHNPNHAACQYMTGLVYCSKGHMAEGIDLLESALETLPWQKEWRKNLIKAYEQTGQVEKVQALTNKKQVNETTALTDVVDDIQKGFDSDPDEDEAFFPLAGIEQFL